MLHNNSLDRLDEPDPLGFYAIMALPIRLYWVLERNDGFLWMYKESGADENLILPLFGTRCRAEQFCKERSIQLVSISQKQKETIPPLCAAPPDMIWVWGFWDEDRCSQQ